MKNVDIQAYVNGDKNVFHAAPNAYEIAELISYNTKISDEFLQKEKDLHKRTEKVISSFGIDTNTAICTSGTIELKIDAIPVIATVTQIKSLPNKFHERVVIQDYISIAEDSSSATLSYNVYGFDHKRYSHFAIPGLQTEQLLHTIDAYTKQQEYESFLEQIEIALGITNPLEKTD
jgi:hypothetical protein